MNHLFKCIGIWHGTSLGPGDLGLYKWSPWGHKWPRPKGHIAKTFKKTSSHETLTGMHWFLAW